MQDKFVGLLCSNNDIAGKPSDLNAYSNFGPTISCL